MEYLYWKNYNKRFHRLSNNKKYTMKYCENEHLKENMI